MRPVVQYLSDEWMQRAGEALAGDGSVASGSAEVDLAIQYEVTGAPGGKAAYTLRIEHGSVALVPGVDKAAPVSFTLDYDTAAQIARGELSAQAAFMQGSLKLGGDVTVLIHQHTLFDGLHDALGELREQTQY